MQNLADRIRSYIRDISSFEEEPIEIGDDDDLLTILDSLQILRMVADFEAQCAIRIDNSELTPENLGTVAGLVALITRKQQEPVC
jgi:acyl carrier protein